MYSERRTKIELYVIHFCTGNLFKLSLHCCFHTQISCQNVCLHRMKRQVQNQIHGIKCKATKQLVIPPTLFALRYKSVCFHFLHPQPLIWRGKNERMIDRNFITKRPLWLSHSFAVISLPETQLMMGQIFAACSASCVPHIIKAPKLIMSKPPPHKKPYFPSSSMMDAPVGIYVVAEFFTSTNFFFLSLQPD